MRLRELRLQTERFAQSFLGALRIAPEGQRSAEIIVSRGRVRLKSDGDLELGRGAARPLMFQIVLPEAQVLVESHQCRRDKEKGDPFARSASYLSVSGSPRSLSAVAMCDSASCMR